MSLFLFSDQIRNGGIEKSFSRKSEVKVFYVDEEEDEIFVDTDDEYRLEKVLFQQPKTRFEILGNTIITAKIGCNVIQI